MKRLLAISLLCLYLLTGTELRQLFKIPVLVEHYQEHKAHNDQLSFASFLYMHYAGDDMNDTDQDRDMQLPFKSCDGPSISVFEIAAPFQSIVPGSEQHENKRPATLHPQDFHSTYLSSIWQPPKFFS